MKKSGESTSDEVDQSTCSSLFDADRYGICQSFTALFVKCWLVFFRKPLQACFVILSPTVLVLINYGVDAYNLVGQLPRDGFNSCGGPVRADSDYYARVNPFFSSILSFGPLVSMLIAISYIQEESKNGVLFLARWSHKLQSLFWLSWWCLFLLSSFASSLLAAAVAKALPDFFYRHCSFGSLFAPLFLLQLAVLFGFSFLVNLCSGFSGKPGVQALLIVLLFGSYFLAGFAAQFSVDSTREGSIGVLDDYDKGNPAVTIPRTTNTSRCVLEPVEHVLSATASGASNSSGDPQACLEFEICLAQLLLEDGVEYWGCWYEASATETMWAPMNAGQVLRLVALVFFPTFHFANIMDEITSIIMMNQSNFDGLEMFFDSMPEAISKVLGFSNQQHLAAYGIDNTQLLTRANRASNVPLVSHCNTKYAYEIPPGGIVGSAAPSYGASLGYLALLAVVYAIGTLVSTRVRFEIGLKRISIASNKRSKRSNRDDSQEGSSSLPSSASAQSLVLENISMMYPGAIQQNKSLDSISLTLSPGQVVALCGRNGAGKSTLLNILAGKLVPSEGSITVGEAIQSTKVGFCFQQDKLYKELSAEEHLLLYARIRGIPPQHVKARVKQWLQETNLYSKRHAPMQALSGGMRRRLSVGLATIGTEGGLVLLDEPSTAVDPVNRRYIWKHIDNVKRDRIVLSSSHSMDEVEVLGDRVLILDRGKILTDDSPFQLKVKYGDILQLTLYCNLVYIPSIVAHIQDNFRARLAPYELHITAAPSGNIAVCIRSPPDDCDTHESSSCSVSTTPLVPPKQSKQPKPQQQQPQSTLASHGSSSTMVEEDEDPSLPNSCQTIATNSASETGASSTSASFSSSQQDLVAVSARTERGDERTESKEKDGKEENDSDNPDSLASIVSELLEWIQSKESNIMEFGVSNTTFDQVFFRVLARHSSFGDRTPMGVPSLPPPSERPGGGPGLVRNELSSLPSSSHSEPMSTFIQVKDNERKALAVLSEQSQHLSGFRLLRTQIFLLLWLNLRTRMFSLEVVSKWVTLLLLITILLVVETTSTHVMSDTLAVVSVLYILPSLLIPSLVFEINNGFLYFLKLHRCTFTAYASAEFIFSSWLFFLVSLIPLSVLYGEGETDLIYKHVEYLTCFSTPEHPCSCFVSQDRLNVSALGEHVVPIATYSISSFQGPYGFVIAFAICYSLSAAGIVLGLSAAFRHYRIAAIVSASILLVFGALISFVYYNYAVSFSYTLPTDSGCVLIPNPMPRTVASSGIRTVGEDHGDCLSRTVQSASVAFDLILPIGLLMSLCSFFFFGTSFEQVEIHAPFTNASVVLPGDCTSTSQQTIAENVGFYFAGVCLWTILCLLLFRYKTFPTSKALSFRLNLLHFTEPCMSWLKKVLCSCKSLGSSQNGSSLMGSSMLSSAGLGSVMCVENERLRVQEHLRSLKQQNRTDVGETGTRRETDASPMPAAVLDDLSKVFHSKHGTTLALDKMNLLLPQGHIVCLLAPNGGGKSTCGALLMNKIDPTSGAAYIGGEDVSFHLNHVLQSIAYIPQDDLWYWPSSTVGQHLTLFAKLRGLTCSAETLDQVVSGIADLLDLTPHLKHKVGSLSGGTKRRLSLALVMLGTPFFAFLDEFSTGLDPITRRTSWACIEYFKAQFNCSMIITTQSMVEAETLSDRIVILTKGKAKAIDSPQGLKDRFGNGYTLLLSVEVEQRKEAFEYVRQTVCGQAVLGNFLNGILRIHFPRSGFCLPTAFKSLFSPRAAEHGILHWLLNQASIEDVFINLAGADEAKLEEIGYLNEAAHKIVVRLLRHQGFTNNQQQTNQ